MTYIGLSNNSLSLLRYRTLLENELAVGTLHQLKLTDWSGWLKKIKSEDE